MFVVSITTMINLACCCRKRNTKYDSARDTDVFIIHSLQPRSLEAAQQLAKYFTKQRLKAYVDDGTWSEDNTKVALFSARAVCIIYDLELEKSDIRKEHCRSLLSKVVHGKHLSPLMLYFPDNDYTKVIDFVCSFHPDTVVAGCLELNPVNFLPELELHRFVRDHCHKNRAFLWS